MIILNIAVHEIMNLDIFKFLNLSATGAGAPDPCTLTNLETRTPWIVTPLK